jgi:hypothetical protein
MLREEKEREIGREREEKREMRETRTGIIR